MKKPLKFLRLQLAVVFSFLMLFSAPAAFGQDAAPAGDAAAGSALFENNCYSCHRVHEDLTGPMLKGVTERRERAWLYKWIKNAPQMVKDGDPIAVELKAKWGSDMTVFGFLTNGDIDNLLAYIETAPVPVPKDPIIVNGGGGGSQAGVPEGMLKLLLGVIAFLALIVLGLIYVIVNNLNSQFQLKVDKGEIDPNNLVEMGDGAGYQISPLAKLNLSLLMVVVLFVGAYAYGYSEVGIQQGYAPSQPINFSHKIHAGQYEIECSYCHIGVERGKSATIPSVNVCMNCHNPKNGININSDEIKKIHKAVDNNQPIEWVRIHNLPDLAYFNHYQHYKVAGIECQECHGPIEEMDVVQQHSNLTMGWCIDCHRKTEVNIDNAYYQLVHRAKIDSFEQQALDRGLTISELGGMECSKCHY